MQKYWDRMSQPREPIASDKNKKNTHAKKRSHRFCISKSFCPPRINQLSSPTLPRLQGLLSAHHDILTTDCLTRIVHLIHEKVTRPATSKVHNKQPKITKKNKCKGTKVDIEQTWLDQQTTITANLITNYFNEQPTKLPNYRQLVLSSQLLKTLKVKGSRKIMKNILDYCVQFVIIADNEWQPYRNADEDPQLEVASELTHERRVVRYVASNDRLLDADSELE